MGRYLNFVIFKCLVLIASMATSLSAAATSPNNTSEQVARIVPEFSQVIEQHGLHSAQGAAEVLYKYQQIQVDDDLNESSTTYVAIRINQDDAIPHYSQMSLNFDSYYETLNLDFAQVITRDGNVYSIPQSAMQVQTANQTLFYNEAKSLVFSVPQLLPGSVIELQYTRKSIRPYIENHWFTTVNMGWYQRSVASGEYQFDAIKQSETIVTLPENISIYVKGQFEENVIQDEKTVGDKQIFTFIQNDIAPIEIEEMMPPVWINKPAFALTTLPDWHAFGKWSYDVFQSAFTAYDKGKILEITQNAIGTSTSKQEQVEKLFAWVQEYIRYVYAHQNRGGFTPHSPNWTIQNGFGDCKDQTALLVAMLDTIGIKAYPALYDSSEHYRLKQAPRLMFNHMIVYIPDQAGLDSQFLDTANFKLSFPGIAPRNKQTEALVITENESHFTKVIRKENANNISMKLEFHTFDDRVLKATHSLKTSGFYDHYFRALWRNAPSPEKILKEKIQSIYSGVKITSLQVNEIDNYFAPLEIISELEFEFTGDLIKGVFFESNYAQITKMFWGFEDLSEQKSRAHGIYNMLDMEAVYEVEIPSDGDTFVDLVKMPLSTKNKLFEVEAAPLSGERVGVKMTFKANLFHLGTEKADQYISPYHQLITRGSWGVILRKGKMKSAIKIAADITAADLPAIKSLIDRGEYDKALEFIKTLLEIELKQAEQAETYYLKGLALGFKNEFEESETAFQKAEEMGYEL